MSGTRALCDGCDATIDHEAASLARVVSIKRGEAGGIREFMLCDVCIDVFNDFNPRTWPRYWRAPKKDQTCANS